MLSAPFAITGELLFRGRNGPNFRSVSQSGRKVVAWSDEIDVGLLRKIGTMSGASDAVILLAAAVDSLKEYFRWDLSLDTFTCRWPLPLIALTCFMILRCSGQPIPDEVLATAKFDSQRSIYVNDVEANGMLCLSLPTKTPLFEDDMIEILQVEYPLI